MALQTKPPKLIKLLFIVAKLFKLDVVVYAPNPDHQFMITIYKVRRERGERREQKIEKL